MFGKGFLTLATLPLLLALMSASALAAPAATPAITFSNLGLSYQSVFNGGFYAPADLSGDISADGQLSRLRGTAYVPLGPQRFELDATAPTAASTISFTAFWQEFQGCDMFGCHWINHYPTYTQQLGSVNVDIRLGTLRGNGTLSWATSGVCTSECVPWGNPYPGYSHLDGGVVDNKDGGRINVNGPAPSIR